MILCVTFTIFTTFPVDSMTRLQQLYLELTGSEFYRNIAGLFSGVFAARLIPALFALVIARIYSPDNFGEFVFFLSIASLLSIVVNGGYEGALLLADTPAEKNNIIMLSLKTKLVVNSMAMIIIVTGFQFVETTRESQWLWLLTPFYSFSFGLFQVVRNYFISNKSFRDLAMLEVYRAAGTGLLQTLFFFLPGTGLFLGIILAQTITPALLYPKLPAISGISRYSPEEIQLARRYRNFPLFNVPSEFFNYLSNQLPVFLIKPFFGPHLLGMYSFSHRYLNTPVQLTSVSIGSVYIQKARSLHLQNHDELAALTWSLVKKQVWIAIIPFTVLALWGKEIFGFLFGPEWEFSGSLAQLLAPWLFMVFISSPLSTILIVKEKQKVAMIFNVFLLVARGVALAAGGLILKDVNATVGLYSLTGLLFFTFLAIYSLYLAGVEVSRAGMLLLKAVLAGSIPLILIKLWL